MIAGTYKVAAGKQIKEITILEEKNNRLAIRFPYNKSLLKEIKSMDGAKWHGFEDPPRKIWTIKNNPRNDFRLKYLIFRAKSADYKKAHPEENPYYHYDAPLIPLTFERSLFDHQKELVSFALTRKKCIIAGDMGIGKTLVAIEVSERIPEYGDIWYVGPVAGVRAVSRELLKWNCKRRWRMLTYDGLVKILKEWQDGDPAPQMLILDESSKIKNPTSQRSVQTYKIAEAIRQEWGDNGYIIEMSGTPSPKSPVDWWHQCEVACPGFLTEGSLRAFEKRLCLTEMRQSITGGEYPHRLTWLDDSKKCAKCGKYNNDHFGCDHAYIPSINEIELLHKRLTGLVVVKMSKDCLDLPELIYEEVEILTTPEILRVAKTISKTARTGAQSLTLLRELSDGFQYFDKEIGEEECPNCEGRKDVEIMLPKPSALDKPTSDLTADDFEPRKERCGYCNGVGTVPKYERDTKTLYTPKDDYIIEALDEHEDVGRLIIWAGFTGSVDKLVDLAHRYGWSTLCVDGRGYRATKHDGTREDANEYLNAMDTSYKDYDVLRNKYPRICFIGHPKAGGMALTLTASPTSIFYSNSFDGEARMQAVKRAHRAGMLERAHKIIDLIHLPTDKLVLDNLENKIRLQNITLGEIGELFHD